MFLIVFLIAESFLKFGKFSDYMSQHYILTSASDKALLPLNKSLISASVKFNIRNACTSLYTSDNTL